MSNNTLNRASLVHLFAQGHDPMIDKALQTAIEGLGWADKSHFTREDVLAITWRIADDARRDMVASDNPEVAEAGAALAPLLALSRDQVVDLHAASQG